MLLAHATVAVDRTCQYGFDTCQSEQLVDWAHRQSASNWLNGRWSNVQWRVILPCLSSWWSPKRHNTDGKNNLGMLESLRQIDFMVDQYCYELICQRHHPQTWCHTKHQTPLRRQHGTRQWFKLQLEIEMFTSCKNVSLLALSYTLWVITKNILFDLSFFLPYIFPWCSIASY